MARRGLACAIAVGLLLAQGLALWHIASVRHHWCSEHQTDEDIDGGDAGATVKGPHSVTPAPHPGGLDHDECGLCGVSLTPVVFGAAAPLAHAVVAIDAVAVSALPTRASARSILRIAPKTSPPAA